MATKKEAKVWADIDRLRERAEWADVWESEKEVLQAQLAAMRAENERLCVTVGRHVERADKLQADLAAAREALQRIARAGVDGLDGARDAMVLGRAIRVARQALKK